jgi:hypothetical protein
MNYHRLIFLSGLIAVLILWAGFSGAQDATMTVTEMVVTTRMFRGSPVDSVRRISSASAKSLYCYTLITSPDDTEREITHVWYWNGEVAGSYILPVKGARWRTYSKKCIAKDMKGHWRVEAKDAEGNLLKALEFRIN